MTFGPSTATTQLGNVVFMDAEAAGKPVIVGVDGSDNSSAALKYAGSLAARLGTRLEDAAKRLVQDGLGRAFSERPVQVDVTVKYGRPGKVLVNESQRAEMLVVGMHGEGGLPGSSMGSVSRACAARSLCPVLLVGQEEYM